MAGMALARPFAYFASRTFATRFLHTLLRGVSRDRLDLLGEEYFHYVLKPQLRGEAAEVDRSGSQRRTRRPGWPAPGKHPSSIGAPFWRGFFHLESLGISRWQSHRPAPRSHCAPARTFGVDRQ